MDILITVLLSVYIGIALYEFYMSYLMGDDFILCVIKAITWPEQMYHVVKQVFWHHRNDK